MISGEDLVLGPRRHPEFAEWGARWDKRAAHWKLPAASIYAWTINDAQIGFPDLRGSLRRPPATLDDTRLFPYQREAAGWLIAGKRGSLLALSPGLGKTAVSIVAADHDVPEGESIIVVAPASLLKTWGREIDKWSKYPKTHIVKNIDDYPEGVRWFVMSWDFMARHVDYLGKGWPLVILDESVMVKSRKTKRYAAAKTLRRSARRVWLLSGSPSTKGPEDLWTQLNLLWPRAYPSYWRFAERYCVVEDGEWARTIVGPRDNRSAVDENEDMILSVNQDDVLDLPEILFEPPLEVDLVGKQLRAYERMRDEFIAELADDEVVAQNEIARLVRLQQIASWWDGESAKHDSLLDVIQNYEPPYLIWTHWVDGGVALHQRLSDVMPAGIVIGATARKDDIIDEFKRGNFPALILSLGVGKFGHTLTGVKTVFYVDKTWSADDYFQSLHRIRRIGLEHRPVVVPIRARDTVDSLVEDNLEGKLGSISKITRSDLAKLLKGIGR